jgi:hypothetical protein
MYNVIEKGQNYKGLWVTEVIDTEKNFTVEIRSFTTKAKMKAWSEKARIFLNLDEKASFEAEAQVELTSRNTGKAYKKWTFVGWSRIEHNWENVKTVKQKGDWLHVTMETGSRYRYHVGQNFEKGVLA